MICNHRSTSCWISVQGRTVPVPRRSRRNSTPSIMSCDCTVVCSYRCLTRWNGHQQIIDQILHVSSQISPRLSVWEYVPYRVQIYFSSNDSDSCSEKKYTLSFLTYNNVFGEIHRIVAWYTEYLCFPMFSENHCCAMRHPRGALGFCERHTLFL